jgi:phosphoadenosine phosphosulfate reductase
MEAVRVASVDPDLDQQNRALGTSPPEELIEWASERYGDKLIASTSFGATSAVMLHLVHRVAPRTPIICVDTGYLFAETYQFAEDLIKRLELDVRFYSAQMSPARQEALYGKLWEQGEEGVKRYLQINKVEPMQRAQMTSYMERHDLPYHPMFEQGYRSIGDHHSTIPTTADMDPRDGRILGQSRECGLHLPLTQEQNQSLKSSGL